MRTRQLEKRQLRLLSRVDSAFNILHFDLGSGGLEAFFWCVPGMLANLLYADMHLGP